ARERRERDLVVTRSAQAVAHHRAHLLRRPFTDGASDHAGLAEATATGAAAEDLDVEPVVHDLDERYELVLAIGPLGEARDRPLVDDLRYVGEPGPHLGDERTLVPDVVHRRHVDAGDRGEVAEHRVAVAPARPLPRGDDLAHLAHRLLAVADHEGVD